MTQARLLCFFSVLAATAAQGFFPYGSTYICDCFDDDGRGHWANFDCNSCAPGYEGLQCSTLTVSNTTECPGYLPLTGQQCNGHGTCDMNTGTCTCLSSDATGYYDGEDCGQCSPTYQGYGLGCAVLKCKATDCNGNGDCALDTIPCGGQGCNAEFQQCCRYTDTVTDPENPLVIQHCESKGVACCGTGTCGFGTSCVDHQTEYCCPVHSTLCAPTDANGQRDYAALAFGGGDCCEKHETCCDGVCCNSNEICRDLPTPEVGWRGIPEVGSDPNKAPPSGKTGKQCSDNLLTAPTAIRAIILPIFLFFAIVGCFISMIISTGFNGLVTILSAVITLLSLFVLFSPQWPFAVLVVLACFFAMGASSPACTNDKRFLYALVIEGMVFFTLLGGVGLTSHLVRSAASPYFPNLRSGGGLGPTQNFLWTLTTLGVPCTQYYGFFLEDSDFIDWSWGADPSPFVWGMCDIMFISALHFFQAVTLAAFMLLMVVTGTAAVNAVSMPTGNQASAPAAQPNNDQTGGTAEGEAEMEMTGKEQL